MAALPAGDTTLPTTLATTITRLRRMLALDLTVFDEVRRDPRATSSSLVVAAGSMLLLALGGWLWWVRSDLGDAGTVFLKSVLIGTLFSLALWLVWLLAAYAVLQRVARLTVRIEELLRCAGLATLPLALGLLMVVPAISFAAGLFAVAAWVLTTQIAIDRCAPTAGGAGVLANLAGFAIWAVAMSLLATAGDPLAPGPFLADSLWEAVAG